MGQSIAQKIIASHTDGTNVASGDLVDVTPDWILANALSMYCGIELMDDIEYDRIAAPERAIVAFDHHVPSSDPTITTHMNEIRRWLDEQEVEHFYDSGEGILHNIVLRKGTRSRARSSSVQTLTRRLTAPLECSLPGFHIPISVRHSVLANSGSKCPRHAK